MSTRTTILFSLAMILGALLAGALLWERLPDPMPAHWNAAGEVDGYMSRTWGVLLLPLIGLVMLGLFLVIPHIDPLRGNIAAFRSTFNIFVTAIMAYLMYLYALTLLAGLGVPIDMSRLLLPAMGGLLIGIGYLLTRAKRNFFIGIRTPWTLVSDSIWERTHRLGARLFVAAGVVIVLSALLGEMGFWVVMAVVFVAALVPVVYSYLLWRRENG